MLIGLKSFCLTRLNSQAVKGSWSEVVHWGHGGRLPLPTLTAFHLPVLLHTDCKIFLNYFLLKKIYVEV